MKGLIVVQVEAPSHHAFKSGVGGVMFHLSKAIAQSNGASINFQQGNHEAARWMTKCLSDLASWSNSIMMPPQVVKVARKAARRAEKKKHSLLGGLGETLRDGLEKAKDDIMEGLTSE